ncbi:MAG TPA: hypothetical protein VHB20_17465 [Verrucomicrobiae bacterium]|jgi:hypothetical protein|nr:hypothetical protein [Verrucomicrobiae bacterium]
MKPTRFALIRANIAAILEQCAPMLVPEERLEFELNLQLRPPATVTEFEHVLARMEQARHILRHRTDEEGVKTKLTELGEAELRP